MNNFDELNFEFDFEENKEKKIQEIDKVKTNKTIQEQTFEKPVTQRGQYLCNKIDEFARSTWEDDLRGKEIPKYPRLDEAFGGIQPGFILIAGDTNHGKSALLTSIETAFCANSDDFYILSFSLDDPFDDKISRLNAIINNETLNFLKNPKRLGIKQSENDPRYIKWRDSIVKLKMLSDKIGIYDLTFGSDINEIENMIKQTIIQLEEEALLTGKKAKHLIVTIDSFHDLSHKDNCRSQDEYWEIMAKKVDAICTTYSIPIICTAELRKAGNRRPILDDIRYASKIRFKIKLCILVYNEVAVKKNGADIYYKLNDSKQPVLELHFSKNKFTDFKGVVYMLFKPDCVKLTEASLDSERKWNNKIFG